MIWGSSSASWSASFRQAGEGHAPDPVHHANRRGRRGVRGRLHHGTRHRTLAAEWVSEFAAGGYIRSLQGRLPEGGFLRQPLASGRDASGRLYAAPFTTDVGLLYYRSDLVPDASALGTF